MVIVPAMTGKPLASPIGRPLLIEVRLYKPGARLIVFSSPVAFAALIAAIRPGRRRSDVKNSGIGRDR